MKLSFSDIKSRLQQKPVVVRPKTHHFSHFPSSELNLATHKISEGLWVIPDYISSDTEDSILEYGVYANPFSELRGRRVQLYGGTVTPEGLKNKAALPQWLEIFAQRLFNERIFELKPNHVLVNEYKPGDGIMPHSDGPAYFPLVATVSLGSDSVLNFWQEQTPVLSVYLPQRSLVIFTDEFYYSMLHSIEMVSQDIILQDGCSTFVRNANLGLSPIKGPIPAIESLSGDVEVQCPICSQPFSRGFINYRETRVSLTIRYVPIIG